MNYARLLEHLERHPDTAVRIFLPDGRSLPRHAHLTEIAAMQGEMIDCGGQTRLARWIQLQFGAAPTAGTA